MRIQCAQGWELDDQIGRGGFGRVYGATGDDGRHAAVKLVPKTPGTNREMLFVGLEKVRNVIPVWDSGETNDSWAIVMPLAERSLEQELVPGAPVSVEAALQVLRDISTALVDLDAQKVVHRDLKPDNILYFNDAWCLADFGISRYAEASTAADTQRYAFTAPYAAPEAWRFDRPTIAADIYAVGVMAHELLAGSLPFAGPTYSDFREQHLHAAPPRLQGVPARLASLIEECLFKAPEARPTPQQFIARLERVGGSGRLPGASRLADAYQANTLRLGEAAREKSAERSEQERRKSLFDVARQTFTNISEQLIEMVVEDAPTIPINRRPDGNWTVEIAGARFGLSIPQLSSTSWGRWQPPSFDVICHSTISIIIPADNFGYQGRAHSLYYGDVQEEGAYGWFETAFMDSPILNRRSFAQNPFALEPGEASGKALGSGMAEYQTAWPFTRLVGGELEDFVDRWIGWFGAAAQGQLSQPMTMPEQRPEGSWRRG